MSDPLGQFLEGALGGFGAGYEFRQGITERKRRRATEEEDRAYQRVQRLREGVAHGLMLERAPLQTDLLRAQVEAARRPPTEPQSPIIGPVTGDVSAFGTRSGSVRPTGARIHPKPHEPKPPTADQTKLADFGTRIINGHAIMTRLEGAVPGIGQRVDAKLRTVTAAERLPAIGGAVGAVLLPGAMAAMTPEEREYFG